MPEWKRKKKVCGFFFFSLFFFIFLDWENWSEVFAFIT